MNVRPTIGRHADDGPLGARDLRVDVVRGLALISMYVAHCAPSGGPGDVLVLSEFLTYPLFAALVGIGAQLADRRLTGPGSLRTWWSIAVRGGVLVGVGLLLEQAGAQIVIVLVYLGVLTWLVAPLARAHTAVVGGVGAAAYVLAPILHDALLDERLELLIAGHTTRARLLDLAVTGENYRVLSMVFFASLGILIARFLLHRSARTQLLVGLPLAATAGVYIGLSKAGLFTVEAYDTTAAEHLFDAMLLTAVILVGLAVAHLAAGATAPLAWIGQMSLTLYAVQIYWLAYYVTSLHPGERDDSWANVAILIVGSFVLAGSWRLVVRRGAWRRGPLEGATSMLARGVRPPRTQARTTA